jgi:VIT1/CCC1 family predicted Fe2+/Mn2+ transporter
MPHVSHLFFRAGILFLMVGISLGLAMSITQNHDVIGAHAHINLLGWVTSALFGGYYALNPGKAEGLLPRVHFWVYTAGVTVMSVALYFLLKGQPGMEAPVAIGSLLVAAGVLIAAWIIFMPAATSTVRMQAAE